MTEISDKVKQPFFFEGKIEQLNSATGKEYIIHKDLEYNSDKYGIDSLHKKEDARINFPKIYDGLVEVKIHILQETNYTDPCFLISGIPVVEKKIERI